MEDDHDIRDLILEILSMEGYETDWSDSGNGAVHKMREAKSKPNLILLDYRLSDQDAAQFRHNQESEPELSKIPVVIISAEAHLYEKMKQIGAQDLLKKPIDIDSLLHLVRRNCN